MPGRTDLAVEATDLTKTFDKKRALGGLNLEIPTGMVYGLLGPNGAGKTTAVRVLSTLVRPDGGQARVFGHDVVQEASTVRTRVALTGQYASVDIDLTGQENLVLLARLLGYSRSAARTRADELLEAFGLTDDGGRTAKTYSGGMRRRLDIAASIVVTPDLLFLDEPTTGLDPRSRNQVWDIVRAVVAHGTTVLLTTQALDEADRLADRVAVIDGGTAIAEGTPGELKASIGAGAVSLRLRDAGQREDALHVLSDIADDASLSDVDQVLVTARLPVSAGPDGNAEWAARTLRALADGGVVVEEFAIGQPTLDEVFLSLTDRPTRQASEDADVIEEVRA